MEGGTMSNEQPEKGKSLIIKGLVPGLAEINKIKIGEKGRMITSKTGKQFQPPQRLDYFRVTTLMRGPDDNYITDEAVHKLHGDKPRVLPVRLLYDQIELNFQCRYVCFSGKKLWCAGDGEAAWRITQAAGQRTEVACPCGRQAPDFDGDPRCKINGCLSVIIDGVQRVGGVAKVRTTSYNSVVGILSSLSLIKRITGGPLAGIPLNLTLNPKTVISPADGRVMNVWVVGLEYVGSVQALQDIGYKQALSDARHYERITHIEEEARRLIAHDPLRMDDEDPAEIAAEFYPEQFQKGEAKGEANDVTTTTSTTTSPVIEVQPGPGQVAGDAAPPATVGAAESMSGTDNGQPGADPQPGQPLTKQDVQSIPRRRRGNKYIVDPALFGGKTELQTCGVTPAQLLNLKNAAKDMTIRTAITEKLRAIGYEELSYLREDEAEELLQKLLLTDVADPLEEAPPPAQPEQSGLPPAQTEMDHMVVPPEFALDETTASPPAAEAQPAMATDAGDKVQCPYDGERRSRSQHCLTTCHYRQQDGWCLAIGENPPGKVDLGMGGAA